jgi:uncharacterized phosphosugar-binding protein
MYAKQYSDTVFSLLQTIHDCETESINKAGSIVAEALKSGGILHVFGCGHSHMIEEELFYRAGGLAAVSPVFESSTMLHEGAIKSSMIERISGYAKLVLERYDVISGDCFLWFLPLESIPIRYNWLPKQRTLQK